MTAIGQKTRIALWAGGAVVALSMVIGAWFQKTISFSEEVSLTDGRKVVVKRWEHLKRSCEGFSCGWGLGIAEIKLPDSPSWESPGLVPLMLDIDANGRPVVLGKPSTCGDHVRMNKPIPPYLQFEFVDSAWRQTSIDRRFHGREANLLIAPNWDGGERSLVTLVEKAKRNTSAGVVPLNKINLDAKSFC